MRGKTWSVALRGELRVRVFEVKVLRKTLGRRREETTENGENCIARSFVICNSRKIVLW